MKNHTYKSLITWTGNNGTGTSDYKAYSRDYVLSIDGKYQQINGSSDPSFLGDPTRFNPEDLFLSSLSSCHMLWYLHLCANNKVVVTSYIDNATGQLSLDSAGGGKFTEVILNPVVTISDINKHDLAHSLHTEANTKCFIANSCNFEIKHNATILI